VPETVAEPTATPVKVAVQLVTVPVVDKVQLAPTVPTAVLDDMNDTVPVGLFAGTVESVTVAVQVDVPVGTIVEGLQETAVAVTSRAVLVTVTVAVLLTGLAL